MILFYIIHTCCISFSAQYFRAELSIRLLFFFFFPNSYLTKHSQYACIWLYVYLPWGHLLFYMLRESRTMTNILKPPRGPDCSAILLMMSLYFPESNILLKNINLTSHYQHSSFPSLFFSLLSYFLSSPHSFFLSFLPSFHIIIIQSDY